VSDKLTQELTDAVVININKAILQAVAQKPSSPLINLEDATIEQIKEFLGSKHTSNWSIFSISSEDSLEKAATWFQGELGKFHAFLYRNEEYTATFVG
jgi:hypothetical protein